MQENNENENLDVLWWDETNKNSQIDETNLDINDISNILTEETVESQETIQTSTSENSTIFDINIKSLDDLIDILFKNEYDFLAVEPNADLVKISFKKDSILKETRNIKFHIYSNILLQAKKVSKLNLEENSLEQKWSGEYVFNWKALEILTKVVPSEMWEVLFLKAKLAEKKVEKKVEKKSISPQVAFWFLGAILLVALILWAMFLTFVVFNAQTPEDVAFFTNLWINLNDINSFLLKLTTILFSIFIIVESIVFIIFLFKAILTKKEFKRKKTIYIVVSVILAILLFGTWTLWMTLDKIIKSLPNWQEMSFWNIQLYDNSLLTSSKFTKENSIIRDFSNIIWPIDIKFDLKYLVKDEQRKWFNITKYSWDFGDGNVAETQSPEIIHTYDKKWLFQVKLTLEWIDLRFPDKKTTKDAWEMPTIWINYLINISQKELPNWWKTISFDARDLKSLWEIEWYLESDTSKPVYEWYLFQPSKIYFDKEAIWMKIKKDEAWNGMDRIFVVSWDNSEINWKINYEASIDNDLEYTFKVSDIENNFWDWFIESFKWIIDWKEIVNNADVADLEKSSEINYTFDTYWKYDVKVIITNSVWKLVELSKEITTIKKMNLINNIDIFENNEKLDNVKYDQKTREYYVYGLWSPTTLTFDAKNIRSDNPLYFLDEVKWNIWNALETWKYLTQDFNFEWFKEVWVKYKFVHRKNKDEIIEINEKINLEFVQRDAVLNLDLKSSSEYAPAIVSFDASLSEVKNDNIIKFVYDYWDWVVEERDAVNPGHKYLREWNYIVKLTVVTEKWKEYSITKSLVLKPQDFKAQISVSMKKAPINQEIDFLSTWSIWQITWYRWDFGDGSFSNDANPSHAYKIAWKYKVKLTLDFANNNVLSDEMEIEIE